MNVLSKNTARIYITCVLIGAVLALLFFLLVMPLASSVRGTRAKILNNSVKIAKLSGEITQFKETESKLAQIKKSVADVKQLFPVREESVVLVEAVEDALARSEVAAEISITDDKEGSAANDNATEGLIKGLKNIEEVSYELDVSGDYRNYVDLLLYMESLPYGTEIVDMSFVAGQELGCVTRAKTGLASGKIRGIFFLKKP